MCQYRASEEAHTYELGRHQRIQRSTANDIGGSMTGKSGASDYLIAFLLAFNRIQTSY